MSITAELEQILSARYGKDVRQAIHDSIEEGYNIAVQAQGTAETSQDSAEAYAAAALASEQNAQDYMELAEQYKNEAFSGTPTGYADLVAKVNSIYKETASSFGVVDTVEGLALAHTIYGMSEQDGTPTPSVPVDIDSAVANFECVGKNLWDTSTDLSYTNVTPTINSDGSLTINETISSSISEALIHENLSIYKRLKPSTTYVFSCAGNTKGNLQIFKKASLSDSWSAVAASAIGATTLSFTTESTQYIYWFRIKYAPSTVINETIYPMILLNGVDTTYERFKSKTITTDLTHRAIEVTSSDDYNLVKDGKYHIADTLNWNEDSGYSITRRVERYNVTDLTVSVTPIYSSITNANWDYTKYVLPTVNTIAPLTYSNYFVKANYAGITGSDGNGKIYFNTNTHVLMIRVDGITSQADWNTWLSNHSDMYVDLILATPTTESITSAQAQALLGLKTYDEATSIYGTGDVAPSVTLEYSKDRSTALGLMSHNLAHINSLKIADLSS